MDMAGGGVFGVWCFDFFFFSVRANYRSDKGMANIANNARSQPQEQRKK
jgi:hypothetical protein